MEPLSTLDLAADLGSSSDEEELVRAWRTEQLRRLGLPHAFAFLFADLVDWHELATLVRRGCPPLLALEIVR
jgi:class 3 adenylate cyclase